MKGQSKNTTQNVKPVPHFQQFPNPPISQSYQSSQSSRSSQSSQSSIVPLIPRIPQVPNFQNYHNCQNVKHLQQLQKQTSSTKFPKCQECTPSSVVSEPMFTCSQKQNTFKQKPNLKTCPYSQIQRTLRNFRGLRNSEYVESFSIQLPT